ncbi:hypothetical protein JCM12296A_34960 [Desulfosarcina cetonica]|uniref:vWA domain-containing protein n=1 Tax=Desulfosarcina cetonica TaxID=90730 RepID=UPI0006CF80BC|nr:vWA domain-containing protein [Desulfosarcina cetonica]
MNINASIRRQPIDRFEVLGNEGYSAFWRKNTSPVETLEMARLLTGLRKVATFIGRNLGSIVWTGMEHKNGIALDPSLVMGTYPVPTGKTDIMVGITVRKAFERTEWSDRIKEHIQSKIDMSPPYRYKFNLFFDMCERVYLDCLSNISPMGLYTEAARLWEISEKAKDFIQPPTVIELLHIWWEIAADRGGSRYRNPYVDKTMVMLGGKVDLTEFYAKPLALLNSIVARLIQDCPRILGVTERCSYRLRLYESIWPELLEYIKFWPADRRDPFLVQKKMQDEETESEEEKKKKKAAILSIAEKVECHVTEKNPDYTAEVRANVSNMEDVVEIMGNDIVMDAPDKIDAQLLIKLKQIVKANSQRRTTYNRGMASGKIDRRRLYRAQTTGKAFVVKKNRFELLREMMIVVDATGSMADPNKWDQALTISQTLFSAILSFNKNARLFTYNEVKDKCRLTEIFGGNRFYTVLPHGRTASGEVLIAAALKLNRKNKKPYIIHITDGASNWGCGVKDALRFCEKKKIRLLTIGIACNPSAKQSLRDEYGRLVQFVDHLDDLPHLFGTLLRHSM